MDWIICALLVIVIIRVARFLQAFTRAEADESWWQCDNVGRVNDYSGVYCVKLKGHFGKHRTSVEHRWIYTWYYKWQTGDKKVTSVDL